MWSAREPVAKQNWSSTFMAFGLAGDYLAPIARWNQQNNLNNACTPELLGCNRNLVWECQDFCVQGG
jgi:hypothetical protein